MQRCMLSPPYGAFTFAAGSTTHCGARCFSRTARGAQAAAPALLNGVQAGDRFVGWLKHPVLTKANKYTLTIEIGPGDSKGSWRIEKPKARAGAKGTKLVFEGPCDVTVGEEEDSVVLRDEDTVLRGKLNGAGPGSLAGRVAQCGLSWGGFFEAQMDELED